MYIFYHFTFFIGRSTRRFVLPRFSSLDAIALSKIEGENIRTYITQNTWYVPAFT